MLYTNENIQKRRNREIKMKKIFTVLIYIILLPIFLYSLVIITKTIIFPNETPTFLGIKTYTIISGSMKPNLDVGDIVVVKSVEKENLQVGDVISYREGERIITHRIVEIINLEDKVRYKTKGDNNNIEDNVNVKYELIEGKVICKIPKLGNLSIFLKNKVVIILIVLILFIYIMRNEKIRKKRLLRKLKREEYEKQNIK